MFARNPLTKHDFLFSVLYLLLGVFVSLMSVYPYQYLLLFGCIRKFVFLFSDSMSCTYMESFIGSSSGSQGYTVVRDGDVNIFICCHGNCGRKFGSRQGIERHTRVHTKEKPFQCSVCPYRCSRKDVLKVHENKHMFDRR